MTALIRQGIEIRPDFREGTVNHYLLSARETRATTASDSMTVRPAKWGERSQCTVSYFSRGVECVIRDCGES